MSFAHYLNRRKGAAQSHLEGGIPDYAYDLDYELRQKMTAIPHFERMCRAVSGKMCIRDSCGGVYPGVRRRIPEIGRKLNGNGEMVRPGRV